MSTEIKRSKFLVIGGAGTIGHATAGEIYSRCPQLIDVIDVSENNLVKLVRDIRSSFGSYGSALRALPLDVGSKQFGAFLRNENISLTAREIECLTWAANGKTEEEIGMIIERSHETARFHLRNAVQKLNASNRTHAVALACSRGLITVL
jgi:DNA-binding CsgD family transcriptional regulator